MFGRRRRPVLGAALVVGASRSAAKYEVQKQAQLDAARDAEIQREIERRKYEEEEQQRRTQLAVDEAVKKANSNNQPDQYINVSSQPPPPPHQAVYQGPAPLPYPAMTGAAYGLPSNAPNVAPSYQPQAPGLGVLPGATPSYLAPPYMVPARPQSSEGLASPAPFLTPMPTNCRECGYLCAPKDTFCSRCGGRLVKE